MGGFIQLPFVPLINILNLLFLDTETVVASKERIASLKQEYNMFRKGLFVLEWERKRYLISQAEPLVVHNVRGEWISYWCFTPILTNVFESFSKHSYTPPILITLSYIEQTDVFLKSTDFESGAQITLSPNSNSINQEVQVRHENDWEILTEEDKVLYNMHMNGEVAKKLSQFKYNYCWS